jgi:hypothetical protein
MIFLQKKVIGQQRFSCENAQHICLWNRKRPKHPKGNRMAPEQFVKEAIVEDWAPLPAPAVIMGTSVESGDCHLHQKQLALALQRFGHFSVFCYSSLFSPVSLPRLLSFFFTLVTP